MGAVWVALFTILASLQLVAAGFEADVRPFLVEHCVVCHSATVKMADLRLDDLTTEQQALANPDIWEDVLRMIASRKMPPSGSARPSEDSYQRAGAWIESRLDEIVAKRKPDPGRVTARRLNRAEYNNTVRDLLHVDLRPADGFPVDDSGYGFDNNADVLSLSPVLMEKYVQAAGRLARAAVWETPRLTRPTRFRIQGSRQQAAEAKVAAIGDVAAYTEDGSIRLTYDFPAAGEYRIAFGAADRRLRSPETGRYMTDAPAPPPRLMTLMLGDERIATKAVEAVNGFDRSEKITRRIAAGKRDIWLGFIDSDAKPINPNVEYEERRLWVDYFEITGPYDADARPLPESHRRIMICTPSAEEPWRPCAERIIKKLLPRAFRRPATDRETIRLLRLIEKSMADGSGFARSIQLALQSVLVSAEFLFRIESDPGSHGSDAMGRISEFELASRMSYFLWSSMPDDTLLDAAARGRLSDAAERRRQVRRMLDDPKSVAFVENFAGQWLQLRNLDAVKPDAVMFPEFDDELRSAMKRETELFFEAIVREDRGILELLDADFTFLNARLAEHYGIDGVVGDHFRKVELLDSRRGGLLSNASILTVSSYPTRTSPVLRGLWVMENLLGQAPPPPPPDIPALEVSQGETAGTLRQQLEQHRADESCASCHQVMDAIGFGLENYDAVGKWRTTDGGFPLDASGELPGGERFESPSELKQILRATEARAVSRTVTKKLMTFALGRGLTRSDNPSIDKIQSRLSAENYRFSTLIDGIVASMPFQMRRRESIKPPIAGR